MHFFLSRTVIDIMSRTFKFSSVLCIFPWHHSCHFIIISIAYFCIAQIKFHYYLVTESERKKVREQFLYAEQELAAAKGREQALQDQLMKEVNESHERLKKQFQQYSELEVNILIL